MLWSTCMAVAVLLTSANAQCTGRADIIIAIPGTNQISNKEFAVFENFLHNLLRYFNIAPDAVNIGLIKYGGEAKAVSTLQPFKDRMHLDTRITWMIQEQMGFENEVLSALKLMRQMFKKEAPPLRDGVQKIGVVFVFGKAEPEVSPLVIAEAAAMKAEGVTVYALSSGLIGPEFEQIGTDRCKLFSMGNYSFGLPSVLRYLGSSICTEMDSTVNATLGNCFPQLCTGRADIIIAIPGTNQISNTEFAVFENFLHNLLRYFTIAPGEVNIGLIIYGSEAKATSTLQSFKDRMRINTRITLMIQEQMGDKNDVLSALKLMRQMFKKTAEQIHVPPRDDVKKIGVVFVFGKAEPEVSPLVIAEAAAIKTEGVTMYALGTGLTGPEFEQIGTDRCKLFSMGNYSSGLPSVLRYLGSSICTEMNSKVNATLGSCFPRFYTQKPSKAIKCFPGARFQDPENCAYYYYCSFNQPVREKCMDGLLFEPSAYVCYWKESVVCYSEQTCPEMNGLFPYSGDCSKYLNCAYWVPYVQSCAPGLWFNEKIKDCDLIRNVECSRKGKPSTLGSGITNRHH